MEDGWLRSGLGSTFPELVWAHGSANLYLSTLSTLSSGCGVRFLGGGHIPNNIQDVQCRGLNQGLVHALCTDPLSTKGWPTLRWSFVCLFEFGFQVHTHKCIEATMVQC